MTPESTAFLAAELRFADVGSAQIAYRTYGSGPALLCLHGWPLSGITFRKIVPRLAEHFTCYVPDTPGAGESRWTRAHDFRFAGQAEAYARLVDALNLPSLRLLAHDTGATIARQLALRLGRRVTKLVAIGTEIPGHRPPFIPLYQTLTALPGSADIFRLLLRSARFRRSAMGFGGCFVDPRPLDEGDDFHAHFIAPLIASRARMVGQIRYLRGIDWTLVDGLAERHREIAAEVLLIWGDRDPIFPADRAQAMVSQLARCRGLVRIPDAALLVHEEAPDAVCAAALPFLLDGKTGSA